MTLMEVFFFLFTGRVSWQYIRKLNTLGTVQRKETLDLTTLQKTVNHYDNSLLILPLFRETYHSVTSRFFSNNTCWKLIFAIHFISPTRLNKILFFYCIIMHYPV